MASDVDALRVDQLADFRPPDGFNTNEGAAEFPCMHAHRMHEPGGAVSSAFLMYQRRARFVGIARIMNVLPKEIGKEE